MPTFYVKKTNEKLTLCGVVYNKNIKNRRVK